MYPLYAIAPQPAHSLYHQPQLMSAAPHPPVASQALDLHRQASPSSNFDAMIQKRYADGDNRLRDAILHNQLLSRKDRQQCLDFVRHLRIYKNLFVQTYEHVVSCCKSTGRYLHLLDNANIWKGWGSVQQLAHHSLIRDKLVSFWKDYRCHQHKYLFDQRFVISDDDSDLLCHLLYCGRKSELYELSNEAAIQGCDWKESEQVIELLWQFLRKPQESGVVRRLRSIIYRMARKSAYLPHDLQIAPSSIANRGFPGDSGANGLITRATMKGYNVVIKKILCGDRAKQRKCLEMFASEAILWTTLQHKNIVPFLGVVMESNFDMGLVSRFFKNGNMRVYMTSYKPKEWPVLAKRWGRDLAKALEYIHLHEPPIVHGDLKGNNVLIDDDGHACLGDFGQSYASDSGIYLDSTRVGLAAYVPLHWMAPEIMVGGDRTKATNKSDVYSFGCVLYEILSGKVPFDGLEINQIVQRVTQGVRPQRPDSIRRDDLVWEVADLCWERPANRPSASRLVSLLH